jgi:hypothetical protein
MIRVIQNHGTFVRPMILLVKTRGCDGNDPHCFFVAIDLRRYLPRDFLGSTLAGRTSSPTP